VGRRAQADGCKRVDQVRFAHSQFGHYRAQRFDPVVWVLLRPTRMGRLRRVWALGAAADLTGCVHDDAFEAAGAQVHAEHSARGLAHDCVTSVGLEGDILVGCSKNVKPNNVRNISFGSLVGLATSDA
jgi:hypothetical protein